MGLPRTSFTTMVTWSDADVLTPARDDIDFISLSGTSWIDPTTMISVRNDSLDRNRGGIARYESQQLVSMKRMPRATGP